MTKLSAGLMQLGAALFLLPWVLVLLGTGALLPLALGCRGRSITQQHSQHQPQPPQRLPQQRQQEQPHEETRGHRAKHQGQQQYELNGFRDHGRIVPRAWLALVAGLLVVVPAGNHGQIGVVNRVHQAVRVINTA